MTRSTEHKDLKDIQDRIGALSVEAWRLGGDAALDQTDAALGVALRHSARITAGMLFFTSAIRQEMLDSLERAEQVLDNIRASNQGRKTDDNSS